VTGRVDQVDQEIVLLGLDRDVLEILSVVELGVQGDGGRLDGDTTLLLVGSGICETGGSSLGGGDNTSALDEGVGEGGLAVVDYSGVRQPSVPAFSLGRGSKRLPWAMTDMLRMFAGLSMRPRIWC
jgi:hypothetical protein